MKKSLLVKIILSICLIACFIGVVFYQKSKQKPASKADGVVTIVVVNKSGEEVVNKNIEFVKGDNLVDLLDKNFKIVTEDGMYGKIILSIEDIVTDFETSYLAIYVNDEYSQVGLSYIELKDKLVVKFVETVL